jgi:hypothetical protein
MSEKIELDENAKEQLVKEVMENFPEYSSPSLPCVRWNYKEMKFVFIISEDKENPKRVELNLQDLVKGISKMFPDIGVKYHNGLTQAEMADASQWDATDADALVQYSLFGEVIFG